MKHRKMLLLSAMLASAAITPAMIAEAAPTAKMTQAQIIPGTVFTLDRMEFSADKTATLPFAKTEWLKALPPDIAVGFTISFKNGVFSGYEQNEKAYTLGLFDCSLTKDNRLRIRLKTRIGEIGAREFEMISKDKIEFNKDYQVFFNYSWNRHRASLYVNGKHQLDIIQKLPLQLAFASLEAGKFDGIVSNMTISEGILNSEDFLAANWKPEQISAFNAQKKAALDAAGANAPFKAWVGAMDPAKAKTVSAARQLKNDLDNASVLAPLIAGKNGISGKAFTVYSVNPTSQEMLTERKLPTEGTFTDTLRIIAAKNEFESASFLMFAFQPCDVTFKISDLRCGANVIPASNLDLRLVKRWFRSGGAWMSYHTDKYQRLLVPDLLVKDENIIRVNEVKRTNELRLTYPEKTVYADVSQFSMTNDPTFSVLEQPLHDSPTLLPVTIPEGGRTQQMWLTFNAPAKAPAGLYEGTIRMFTNKGKTDAGTLKVQVRLLPFDLPDAKTYYDSSRNYLSWLTGDLIGSDEYKEKQLKFISEHSVRNFQGLDWKTEEGFLKSIALRKKYNMDNSIFLNNRLGAGDREYRRMWDFDKRDVAFVEKYKNKKKAEVKPMIDWVKKHLGHSEVHFYGNDEAAGYMGLRTMQEPLWEAIHEVGGKISTAGGPSSFERVPDLLNVHAITVNEMRHANNWHSVGGRLLNYASPFSGPENPLIFRRQSGLLMYKLNYDGWFILSFTNTRVPWNEFAGDPGGDGNYRHFGMVYHSKDGPIGTMAMCGLREAIDDVRYATLLKDQATKAAASANLELQREGKRQLAWLHMLNAETCDLDFARMSMIDRILTLRQLMQKGK